uniref:Uncharacterized protein n=1 Tax=viral metagenome TaxID=1070528 RepID=A0A6M3L9A9_9ZZZZ
MAKWRPGEGWDETLAKENMPSYSWGKNEYGVFLRGISVGADAMLEALRKRGSPKPPKDWDKYAKHLGLHDVYSISVEVCPDECDGTVVFIPDDEVQS